jgi:carbon-monoxide dehydrogenase medium subunit
MKPTPFAYRTPSTVQQAVAELAECAEEGGKVIAGGQSLIPMLNYRLVRPPVLVDLGTVADLRLAEVTSSTMSLGAMTTTGWLARSVEVLAAWPLMAAAAGWVGHAQIRSRGTVGGSVVHADPSAEMPALMMLANASLHVESPAAARTLHAEEFFLGYMTTALAEDEILTKLELHIPCAAGRWGFEEFAPRLGDFAEAGAACVAPEAGGSGVGRAVLFGVADRPLRAPALESLLTGDERPLDRQQVADAVMADLDTAGTATPSKRDLAVEMAIRAVARAGC